jgi:prolyl-tRNA synthetase
MKITNYFIPILKETPSDASVVSHQLMIRAGMIRQQNSGIYVWLPLGLRVLKKIEGIVRKGMEQAGATEILMPCIQPQELWDETGRSDSYGKEMLKIVDRHEHKLLFGPTNEEVVTDLFRNNIKSYKALPKNLYHIQWKFRDEIRPRFGLLRGREFLMKDAYSFDLDKQSAELSYNNMFEAYIKIFKALGLKAIPARAPSGPIGGDLTHEFHILSDEGESQIFYDPAIEGELTTPNPSAKALREFYSVTDEVHETGSHPSQASLKTHKSIEIGHIFYSGTKYTDAMRVTVTDESGQQIVPYCGCYGIGVSRLVAAIIETSYDAKGIIWHESIAPFQIALINLHTKDEAARKASNALYDQLNASGLDTLYDDSTASPGSKLATQDLIGIPWQIIVSSKLVEEQAVEVKNRRTQEIKKFAYEEAIAFIRSVVCV